MSETLQPPEPSDEQARIEAARLAGMSMLDRGGQDTQDMPLPGTEHTETGRPDEAPLGVRQVLRQPEQTAKQPGHERSRGAWGNRALAAGAVAMFLAVAGYIASEPSRSHDSGRDRVVADAPKPALTQAERPAEPAAASGILVSPSSTSTTKPKDHKATLSRKPSSEKMKKPHLKAPVAHNKKPHWKGSEQVATSHKPAPKPMTAPKRHSEGHKKSAAKEAGQHHTQHKSAGSPGGVTYGDPSVAAAPAVVNSNPSGEGAGGLAYGNTSGGEDLPHNAS